MKKLILIILLFVLTGCVKYQVVQKLDDNMYHLYKEKEGTSIITTPDKLEINKFYKLKDIKIINER